MKKNYFAKIPEMEIRMTSSYPRPILIPNVPTVYPRQLAPIKHQLTTSLPTLPSPPRSSQFGKHFTLSSHIFSAAFPRTPFGPAPASFPEGGTKEEREARIGDAVSDLTRKKLAYERGELNPSLRGERLWIVVNRYVRNGLSPRSRGITIVAAHANGLHKEVGVFKLWSEQASLTKAVLGAVSLTSGLP